MPGTPPLNRSSAPAQTLRLNRLLSYAGLTSRRKADEWIRAGRVTINGRPATEPGERALVPTGIALAVPEGWAAFVHPRSGLAAREGLTIVNAPGTIDSGYRGEVRVCLLNTDRRRRVILHRGDLIAQLVFQRVGLATFVESDELPLTARGSGGYGSTGGVAAWDGNQGRTDSTKGMDE